MNGIGIGSHRLAIDCMKHVWHGEEEFLSASASASEMECSCGLAKKE